MGGKFNSPLEDSQTTVNGPLPQVSHGWKVRDDWYDPKSYFKPDAPSPPAEILTLRAEGFTPDPPPKPDSPEAEMAGARDLFRQGEYDKAERLFHYHAEKASNPVNLRTDARFYEAECLRLEGNYPKASDIYVSLLTNHPQNPYREQSLQHVFDIANFWLEDTREEMHEMEEKRDGKRWIVWPRFISFEKKKPFMDREGNAIAKLEQVRLHDINGPLADKALFLCGSVKFFNEDFREADLYFSQIYERHKDSPLAPQAIELAIICKHMGTGGADYDGRKVVEARKLVQAALSSYPELAGDPEKRKFLTRQLAGITMQQAEKDFKIAEFWRRKGHPGSAYWYYGLVVQRYPKTTFAEMAAKRMEEILGEVEKENATKQQAPKLPAPSRPEPERLPPGLGSQSLSLPGAVGPGGRP